MPTRSPPSSSKVTSLSHHHATRSQTRLAATGATASPDQLRKERLNVRHEVVDNLGLALKNVQADGNCIFRALGNQLMGTERCHMDLRQAVCDDLVEMKGSLEEVLTPTLDGKTYDQYVEGMRQDGELRVGGNVLICKARSGVTSSCVPLRE